MDDELIKQLRNDADEFEEMFGKRNDSSSIKWRAAADAIEELSAKYEKALNDLVKQEKPKWIPVTERLPEKPDGYLRCQIRRTYYLVALESGCVKTLGYEFDRDEWQITGSPVTHWMSLPEPPKEEDDIPMEYFESGGI